VPYNCKLIILQYQFSCNICFCAINFHALGLTHRQVGVLLMHMPIFSLSLPFLQSVIIFFQVNHVGDSPRGPLKQLGNPHLKPAKAKRTSLEHTGHGPRHGSPDGPPRRSTQRSPRADSASFEGTRLPRAGSAPFEGARLPRAGPASLEGPRRPRAGSASLEGAPHVHARPRTRAFNVLTMAGRHHHAPGARAPVPSHQLPRRGPIPATVGDCATWPVPVP
jgi:hypothetical protein